MESLEKLIVKPTVCVSTVVLAFYYEILRGRRPSAPH